MDPWRREGSRGREVGMGVREEVRRVPCTLSVWSVLVLASSVIVDRCWMRIDRLRSLKGLVTKPSAVASSFN